VWFKVWWLLEITAVVPKRTVYYKLENAKFDVYYRTYRMQPFDAVKELTVYDDLDVPIGAIRVWMQGLGWGNYDEDRFWTCIFKEYEETLAIFIPKWAFATDGKVYANAFHWDWTNPYYMGTPTCPEKMATFTIMP